MARRLLLPVAALFVVFGVMTYFMTDIFEKRGVVLTVFAGAGFARIPAGRIFHEHQAGRLGFRDDRGGYRPAGNVRVRGLVPARDGQFHQFRI